MDIMDMRLRNMATQLYGVATEDRSYKVGNLTLSIKLDKEGTEKYKVVLQVNDEADKPIKGATVRLIDDNNEYVSRLTGSKGGATLNDILEGTYQIKVDPIDGYSYDEVPALEIKEDEKITITLNSVK